jgi:hypothetical protein
LLNDFFATPNLFFPNVTFDATPLPFAFAMTNYFI